MPSEYASAATVEAPSRVTARTSAVVEVQVAIWMVQKHALSKLISGENPWLPEFLQQQPELVDRVRNFWPGEKVNPEWLELFVLAQRSETLLDGDFSQFVERLDSVLDPALGTPILATESAAANGEIQERIQALTESPELRREYANVLQEVFEALRPRWDREGRTAAEERTAWLSAQLPRADDPLRMLPPGNIARNEVYAELMQRQLSENDAVIVPVYFGGRSSCVVALPGLVLIAQGLQWGLIEEQRRSQAKMAAKRFKILSDPTRLAILAQLTRQPTSIRDLAQRFELSQPTVSTHVKMLRETGLLDSRQAGNLTLYYASGNEIRQWIADGANTVLDSIEMMDDCPIISGRETPLS